LAFERLAPAGEDPGWLSGHDTVVEGDALVVRGGRREVELPDGRALRDNPDDFALTPATMTWRRLTDRRWSQFALLRADGRASALWQVSSLAFVAGRDDEWSRGQVAWHREQLGFEPDLEAWAARYTPPVAHTVVPPRDDDEDTWRTHRLVVDGVTVRYTDDAGGVRLVVEGPLPPSTIAALVEDLRDKLGRVERTTYRVRPLTPAA